MTELPANGIYTAAISTVVVVVLYFIKEYGIEPRRWKRNLRVSQLEKRLEAYGNLLTILQSCARKGLRQNTGFVGMSGRQDQVDLSVETKTAHLHILENPHDADALQSIFEKSHFLLSKELRNEWLKFVRDDEFFTHFDSRRKEGSLLRADLWKMQVIAQKDFDAMEQEYDKLTGQNKNRHNPFGMKHGGDEDPVF